MDRPPHLSLRSRQQASSRIRELLRLTERPGILSLAGGLPAPEAFPEALIRDAFEGAMRHRGPTGTTALQYAPTEGLGQLREQIAAEEGCSVDEVLVTTGSQQALHLLARVLCDDGDVAVTADPTYLGALQALRAAGVPVEGVPAGGAGLDVEALAARLRGGLRPRLVYVVPNFDNPTGATLPEDARREILQLADRFGFVVVEDDPYGRLRFAGRPLPPLGSPGRPVVRLGSASKVLAPGLRVGWMTGPREIVAAAARAKQSVDLHTSSLDQLVVFEARSRETAFARHLAAAVELYAARAAALQGALARHLGDGAEYQAPEGGMFLWVRLPGVGSTEELLVHAAREGVAFVPGPAFAVDGVAGAQRARLGYATLDPVALDEAVARLAAAIARTAPAVR